VPESGESSRNKGLFLPEMVSFLLICLGVSQSSLSSGVFLRTVFHRFLFIQDCCTEGRSEQKDQHCAEVSQTIGDYPRVELS